MEKHTKINEISQEKVEQSLAKNNSTLGKNGIALNTYQDLLEFSTLIANSDLCPKSLKKKDANGKLVGSVENVLIAVQLGIEIGLKPLQSVQNITVINGIPSIYGDAAKALVMASQLCEKFEEYFTGTEGEDDWTAVCITKRVGQEPYKYTFSVADAKKAKLWGKVNTYEGKNGTKVTEDSAWVKYPKRMLMFRARGFNLRDCYPDVLGGFKTVEEISDYEIISSTENTDGSKTFVTKQRGLNGMHSAFGGEPNS